MHNVAIGAIFKNEAPYIIDWLAWHRAVGIKQFLIADNDSDDDTTLILRSLHDAGLIEHIPFPSRLHHNPQLEAYSHILSCLNGKSEWVAFIDADEFITPTGHYDSFVSFLSETPPNVGALVLNWANYGSSGNLNATRAPVFERFVRRATQHRTETSMVENRHFKCVLRSAAATGRFKNAHYGTLKEGFDYFHSDFTPVTKLGSKLNGLSENVCWENWRLNHYIVKSKAEFINKKLPRGLADLPDHRRTMSFFSSHDDNSVFDPPSQLMASKFEHEKALIVNTLGAIVGALDNTYRTLENLDVPKELPTAPENQDITEKCAKTAKRKYAPIWERIWRKITLIKAARNYRNLRGKAQRQSSQKL